MGERREAREGEGIQKLETRGLREEDGGEERGMSKLK